MFRSQEAMVLGHVHLRTHTSAAPRVFRPTPAHTDGMAPKARIINNIVIIIIIIIIMNLITINYHYFTTNTSRMMSHVYISCS